MRCERSLHGYLAGWRHQMETFSASLAICAGNSLVTQRLVTRSFDVFFDLRLNIWLSKQWWGWWFKTSSRPLWRHCIGFIYSKSHKICTCCCCALFIYLYTSGHNPWKMYKLLLCLTLVWLFYNTQFFHESFLPIFLYNHTTGPVIAK